MSYCFKVLIFCMLEGNNLTQNVCKDTERGRHDKIIFFDVGKKLYFCKRFWFPRKGAKRESGESPGQSRCCEFQMVTQLLTKRSLRCQQALWEGQKL